MAVKKDRFSQANVETFFAYTTIHTKKMKIPVILLHSNTFLKDRDLLYPNFY